MALLDEILSWATKELKPWQSDAVRRLFQRHDLTEADFAELLAMLQKSKGIDVQAPEPQPLLEDHLPQLGATASNATLAEIRDLKFVNRLAANTVLAVAETGVTVIYGDNGSGKSGFSRVIKSACRARIKGEPVLGDVRLEVSDRGTASALFRLKSGGVVESTTWMQGLPAPATLAHVAIFDSKCARAYTDSEGDFIFLPWGLEVLEKLTRIVFVELERRVQAQARAIDTSTTSLQDLFGQTEVGQLLQSLTARTSLERIAALSTISEIEMERIGVLEKIVAEKDPLLTAKRIREVAGWIRSAANRINERTIPFEDAAANAYALKDKNFEEALAAEKVAATILRSGDSLIDGTGDGQWKQLFQSAMAFATAHHHPVPSEASEGDICVLCQQPLDHSAASRLQRFGEYLQKNASREASIRAQERKTALDELKRLPSSFELSDETLDLFRKRKPELVEVIAAFENTLKARKSSLISCFESHAWTSVPALGDSPIQSLINVAEAQIIQAETLTNSADPEKRALLIKELAELQARLKLKERKAGVVELIERMKKQAAMLKCLDDLKPRPISNKVVALTQSSVTTDLERSLNEEFAVLGIASLQARMVTRIEQGKPKVKLALDFPGAVKPEQVLSEGEQRSVAIASFLAELKTAGHLGPVIFDDPVSSLDHRRRMSVAHRLVTEAKRRQVLIFTHDAVFLADLLRIAKEDDAPLLTQHLSYSQRAAGIVNEGLPWIHLPYKDRLDKLEKAINAARRDWDDLETEDAELRIRTIYSRMREICERIVQDVAFEGVVERFNNYIRVPNLLKVAGLELAPCTSLVDTWQKASDVTLGHDKASAGQAQLPDPDEAMADLNALRATVSQFKQRHAPVKLASAMQPSPITTAAAPSSPPTSPLN